MPRKEQFAFGAALVASALAFVLSKALAWFVLIIGLGLIFDFYFRDVIWGKDRLTREEIEKMSAEEYKARVLGNPKTEWWVNWQISGRDMFKKRMRKLAREAVIFMLVTPFVFMAAKSAFVYHEASLNPYRTVKLDLSRDVPIPPLPPGYENYPFNRRSKRRPLIYQFCGSAFMEYPLVWGFWVLFRAICFAIKG
jgi:hypothetical protein